MRYFFFWVSHLFFVPVSWVGVLLPSNYILSGFIFWGVLLHWIPLAIAKGGFPLILGIVVLFFISALLSLFFVPFYLFRRSPFVSVILFCIFEYLRLKIFPWGLFSSSFYHFMKSGYPIFVLTFISLMPGVLVRYAFGRDFRFVIPLVILVVYFILPSRGKDVPKISVSLLREEVSRVEQWGDAIGAIRRFERYLLTAPKSELVVMPELFLPYPFEMWYEMEGGREILEGLGKDVVFGVIWQGGYTGIGEKFWNVGIRWDSGGRDFEVQGKEKLVPFGERVPLRGVIERIFPFLFRGEMMRGDFSEWEWGRKVMNFRGYSFAIYMCWEVLFGVRRDIDFALNLTNDVWFETEWGMEQHFWYSVMVARSSGVVLIRSTNWGISGVIFPDGDIVEWRGRGFKELDLREYIN